MIPGETIVLPRDFEQRHTGVIAQFTELQLELQRIDRLLGIFELSPQIAVFEIFRNISSEKATDQQHQPEHQMNPHHLHRLSFYFKRSATFATPAFAHTSSIS